MFFYAERWTDKGLEKALFLSLAEFIPYRAAGWSASPEINGATDKEIAARHQSEIEGLAFSQPGEAKPFHR